MGIVVAREHRATVAAVGTGDEAGAVIIGEMVYAINGDRGVGDGRNAVLFIHMTRHRAQTVDANREVVRLV